MTKESPEQLVDRALERMYARRNAGIKFDLETMRNLLERLDSPQRDFAAVHVAGTNGKGSVCAMIASVLRARGLRPGLYTSPHLVRFNERMQIDATPITDGELAPLIEQVETADRTAAASAGGRPATFFEFTTALAFLHFRFRGTRIAVIETGLGGRLDATNVVNPAVAVITRIGLDHGQWLGTTLADVATEKAGIIKPGRPLVCGAMPDEAREVIARIAATRGVSPVWADENVSIRPLRGRGASDGCRRLAISGSLRDYGTVSPALPGEYQTENLATAVAALETFSRSTGIDFDEKTLARGLQELRWPARLQRIGDDPPVLLDGAHNPDGAAAVMRAVSVLWKRRPVALVAGICNDKDYERMLRIFQRRVRRCWTVPFSSERAMPPDDLAAAARRLGNWEVVPLSSLPAAMADATAWARENNGIVLIAGSLFLAGDVLRLQEDKTLPDIAKT